MCRIENVCPSEWVQYPIGHIFNSSVRRWFQLSKLMSIHQNQPLVFPSEKSIFLLSNDNNVSRHHKCPIQFGWPPQMENVNTFPRGPPYLFIPIPNGSFKTIITIVWALRRTIHKSIQDSKWNLHVCNNKSLLWVFCRRHGIYNFFPDRNTCCKVLLFSHLATCFSTQFLSY